MLLCRNVLLLLRRFHYSAKYFTMDNLLTPGDIRGMKILKKEQFEKFIKIPCIIVKMHNLKEALKYIKPYLLKLVAFNAVRIRDENFKEILLNPNIVKNYEDISLEAREGLSNICDNINFEFINVKLTYDNWKASEILSAILPKELGNVSGYSLIGHIVHLNLRNEFSDYKSIIGQVLLDKIPQAKTVVNKVDNIDNEFRTFQLEVLAGIEDFMVEVVENRCNFKFDFSKVYWNPRLCTEHLRIVENLKQGDVLYDIFAGVGPFTVPAAKKGCTVLANDLNSDAIKFLRENLRLNKVKHDVVTTIKDASDFIKEDFKKHFLQLKPGDYKVNITMNLPALAPTFLHNFVELFKQEDQEKLKSLPTPQVYVYCFIKGESDPYLSAKKLVYNNLNMNIEDEVESVSFVRNVAPNKEMMRVTLKLTSKILLNINNKKRSASPFEDLNFKKSNQDFLSQDKSEEIEKIIQEDEKSQDKK